MIDRSNGGILWERQLRGAPGAGPGVSATHAFVPMINGLVEGLRLEQGRQADALDLQIGRPRAGAADGDRQAT